MDEGSSCFSHGFSLEVELVGVVDEAVEDGVGEGGVADGRRSRIRADVNWESLVERHADEVMTENPDEDPVGVRGRRRPGAKTKKVSLTDPDASMSTSASNRQPPSAAGPARSCRRGAPRQPAQSLPEDWIASGRSVGSHRVRGHRDRPTQRGCGCGQVPIGASRRSYQLRVNGRYDSRLQWSNQATTAVLAGPPGVCTKPTGYRARLAPLCGARSMCPVFSNTRQVLLTAFLSQAPPRRSQTCAVVVPG